MNPANYVANRIYHTFVSEFNIPHNVSSFGLIQLPQISSQDARILIFQAEKIFTNEPNVIKISSRTVIIGDLHGHIFDLLRILKRFESQEDLTFLFLGDIIDRGEFSFETLLIVLSLKIIRPKSCYVLRGNHEFSSLYEKCGFSTELNLENRGFLLPYFDSMFSQLPLAAILNQTVFCVHGGIGPSFKSISQLEEVSRPIYKIETPVVEDILWSDPTESGATFYKNPRGLGSLYGAKATQHFLKTNRLKIIVRGHQCILEGVYFSELDNVITIFSASHYCGKNLNRSGICIFDPTDNHIEPCTFSKLPYIKRNDLKFRKPTLFVARDNEHEPPDHLCIQVRTSNSYHGIICPILNINQKKVQKVKNH